MEAGEAKALAGESIEFGRGDLAPEGADIAVPEIVRHDEQDIGRRRGCDILGRVSVHRTCREHEQH